MSRDQVGQSPPPPSEQSDRRAHIPYRALETYPEILFAKDMARIFRLSLCRFYVLASEGAFDFAINRPRIGKKSWSRERVRQYLAGEMHGLTVARRRA